MVSQSALHKLGLRDLDLSGGKRVLVRVDFNVPLREGRVADDSRIRATLPTLDFLTRAGARVVLMSHLGRPKKADPALSLAPVAARLSELTGKPVAFATDCIGEGPERMAGALAPGGLLLLENLRFHPEEEANESGFAKALARLGQAYVNDAFGTAHRAHASTVGVTAHLHPAVAGFLLARELEVLGGALERPARPFVAILGGAKISGKIDVITHLLPRVDRMLIGGAMMFTFAAAKGLGTGRSLVEPDRVDLARDLLRQAGPKLVLPVDTVAAKTPDANGAPGHVVPLDAIPADESGVDIGPETVRVFALALAGARTVLWNGPMGIFEVEPFARGTREVAELLARATSDGATTIVGGGDSVAAVEEAGLGDRVTHLSTGGGASLEFLEGKVLPGVAALTDAS
jgi:phosphoglycerate kinase